MLPELHISTPLPLDPVVSLAQATRDLWLKCRQADVPLDRADAMIEERSASAIAAAKILMKNLEIVSPKETVLRKGYFVGRLLSIHERSAVLLTFDTETYRVKRGFIELGESSTSFVSTYRRAKPGHYMFRRTPDGRILRRVCFIQAEYVH